MARSRDAVLAAVQRVLAMTPRRPAPDPLVQAKQFLDEAARAHGDWRRSLLHGARAKLDDARHALADGEEALQTQRAPIADLMRKSLEERRREIERVAALVNELLGQR